MSFDQVSLCTGGLSGGSRWLLCGHYERRHTGECHKLIGGCFNCVSKEHLLRDCLNRVDVSQTQSSAPASMLARGRGQGKKGNKRPIGQ